MYDDEMVWFISHIFALEKLRTYTLELFIFFDISQPLRGFTMLSPNMTTDFPFFCSLFVFFIFFLFWIYFPILLILITISSFCSQVPVFCRGIYIVSLIDNNWWVQLEFSMRGIFLYFLFVRKHGTMHFIWRFHSCLHECI